ncbi:MAG: hypothetical protein II127_03770, partial [Ruminococcus sp.]|nr:hypothetical protein [Ruminococcus sp.]
IDVYAFLVINQMIITPKEFFVIENSSKNIIPLNEITSIAILRTKNDGDKCVPFIQIETNNGKKYDFYIEGNQLKKNSDIFFILNKLQKYSPSVNEIIIEEEPKKEESKTEESKVEKPEVEQSKTEESINNNINADNPTKFCVFCGSKIARTSKFCNYCGKRMTT